MPRKPCFNRPGVPQHVVRRSNYRGPWFLLVSGRRDFKDKVVHMARQ